MGGPGGGRLWGLRRVGGAQWGWAHGALQRAFPRSLHGDIVALCGWLLSLYPVPYTLLHNPPNPRGSQRPHTSVTPPHAPPPASFPASLSSVCSGGLGTRGSDEDLGSRPAALVRSQGTSCCRCVPCQLPAAGGPARHRTRASATRGPRLGPVRGVGVLPDAHSRDSGCDVGACPGCPQAHALRPRHVQTPDAWRSRHLHARSRGPLRPRWPCRGPARGRRPGAQRP